MERQLHIIHARKHEDFDLTGDLSVFRASGTPTVCIDRCWDGTPAGRLASDLYCLWSETALYFGFSCPYQELTIDTAAPVEQPRWQLWDLDIAEVLISPQCQRVDHYYEFEVAPSGHWIDLEVIFREGRPFYNWDRRLNAGVCARIDPGGAVWTAELKVPIKVVSSTGLQAGDEWSLNLFRADGPPDLRRYLALWPTLTPRPDFHVPSRFGRIRFVR
ncbi:MAG: hypothetical protein EHM23_03510 [Acidobacteria bacterium]|nr:MAG: hypothetical protein EHM23_03510 [Acidobacteriota bacterium]